MTIPHILLFGGTTEGRQLAEFFSAASIPATISVATAYGESLLPHNNYVTISCSRLQENDICQLINDCSAGIVVDATHPYAVLVSETVRSACRETNTPFIRIDRAIESIITTTDFPSTAEKSISVPLVFPSNADAAAYLSHTSGNILLTIGSKNLASYTVLSDFAKRIYARILPDAAAINICLASGLLANHIIAMQGPFSIELNTALLHEIHASFLVTKNSGKVGGFSEKLLAAENCHVTPIIISAPTTPLSFPSLSVDNLQNIFSTRIFCEFHTSLDTFLSLLQKAISI